MAAIFGLLIVGESPAHADWSTLWSLGTANGDPQEFHGDYVPPNNAPGSAAAPDNDYYFAGSYGTPIGSLAANEPPGNFKRYCAAWDPRQRVHFMLSAAQASATARFRVTFYATWLNVNATNTVVVRMNGHSIGTFNVNRNKEYVATADAGTVAPVAGANVVEFERTGGTVNEGIAFDALSMEANPTALVDADGDGLPQWWEQDHGFSDSNAADATQDADGDGFTNSQEYPAGIDPRNKDSDGDGLTDGSEADTSHTNPLLADTDGDGVNDGDEANVHHTNPLLTDSDGDGAPDGWELRTGYDPNLATSKPPDSVHSIGIKFVCDIQPDNFIGNIEPAGFVPQIHWNNTAALSNWNLSGGNTALIASPAAGALVDSAGAGTGTTLSWTSDNTWNSGNGGSGNGKLLDGYLNVASDNGATVTLVDIPFASYDLLLYVGANYPGALGYARLNGSSATDRHFSTDSTRPVNSFTEPALSNATRPWRGNLIRFRNVTGSTASVQLFRSGSSQVGLHAIQIVNRTLDTDGDGMPDWWEFAKQLKPDLAADAAPDPDGDDLTNAQEYARGTDPHIADTDGDRLSDGVETNTGSYLGATNTGTNPLLPDTDGDGLGDGDEVEVHHSNPLLADTDGDGRGDRDELTNHTDPLAGTPANASMPVVTTSPRTFTWQVDNVQLVWDHNRGHVANSDWGDEYLCMISVSNAAVTGDVLNTGLRVVSGHVTHFLFSNHAGAFSETDNSAADIWESDWNNPPTDKRAALGFSGAGPVDISDRLRFTVTGTSTGAQNNWTLNFELRNVDKNTVVASATHVRTTLAANVHDNTATWQNNSDPAVVNRLSFYLHPGIRLFMQGAPLGNTPAFAAWKDSDDDGMPDLWEDANGLDKNSAGDAALDPDQDGLANLQECLRSTHPHIADTDADGANDGAEVAAGSDPLIPTSKPPYFTGLPAEISGEDLNGNGIPDAFEQWAGSFTLQGGADSDGDGYTDLQEATAGTNPLDAASHPWLDTIRSGNDLTLRWPRLLNKQHSVYQSPDLVNWTPVGGAPATLGNEFRQTLTGALSNDPRRFYQVGINDLDSDADGVSDWTEINVLHSDPNHASSLRAPLQIDANLDGAPDMATAGDYTALIERFQGGSVDGGFANGSGAAGTGGFGSGISRAQAARFLTQASFGPTMADIERVQQLGYAAWIDEQMAKPATLHSAYIKEIYADYFGPRIGGGYNASPTDEFIFGNNLMTAFARAAIQGEDQLRQRVAFALSQILVASRRDANLENQPLGMSDFYDIFVRRAFGNYRDVLQDVAMHPCMGRYLSHVGNQKAIPEINQYPDENFAREAMQLFSIGLWELNQDGTRQVDGSGQNIPTYSNTEITQLARVMTGLWFSGHYWGEGGWYDADYATPMTLHAERHDFGAKTLVHGIVIPARDATAANAMQDIADAMRILFEHANCAPFIGKQLIQFLVTDNPSPAYVQRVAAVFADNGGGVRGDLGAVVRAILLDAEARDPRHPENLASYGRLKEPVIRTMALARVFGMKGAPDFLWWDWGDFFDTTRQEPTRSPSVFNFYRPEYRAAGLLTTNDLAGPVFQITDSFSSIAFPNKLWDIMENGFSLWGAYRFPLDLARESDLATTPELLVDELNTLFCAGRMSAATRSIIVSAVAQIPAGQPEARARVAAYLVLVSPEGAVMK